MTRDYKDIIVAGGGTAGFITALILKANYGTNVNVKMIVPSNIGIIGVGEGSTEHFTDFRHFMGVSEEELISKTKATGKAGIKFVDWMKDKTYYHVISGDFQSIHAGDDKCAEFRIGNKMYSNYDWVPSSIINDDVE